MVKSMMLFSSSSLSILGNVFAGYQSCADPRLKNVWHFHLMNVGHVFINQLRVWISEGYLSRSGSEFVIKTLMDDQTNDELQNDLQTVLLEGGVGRLSCSIGSSWKYEVRKLLFHLSHRRRIFTLENEENTKILCQCGLWPDSTTDKHLIHDLIEIGLSSRILAIAGRDRSIAKVEAAIATLEHLFESSESACFKLRQTINAASKVVNEEFTNLTSKAAFGASLRACRDVFLTGSGHVFSALISKGFPYSAGFRDSSDSVFQRNMKNTKVIRASRIESSTFDLWMEETRDVSIQGTGGVLGARGALNCSQSFRPRLYRSDFDWHLDLKNVRSNGLRDVDMFVSRGVDVLRKNWVEGGKIPSLMGRGGEVWLTDALDVSHDFDHTVGCLLVENDATFPKGKDGTANCKGGRFQITLQGSQHPSLNKDAHLPLHDGNNSFLETDSFAVDVRVMETQGGRSWQGDVWVLKGGKGGARVIKSGSRVCGAMGSLEGVVVKVKHGDGKKRSVGVSLFARRRVEQSGDKGRQDKQHVSVPSLLDNSYFRKEQKNLTQHDENLFLLVHLKCDYDFSVDGYFPEDLAWAGIIPIPLFSPSPCMQITPVTSVSSAELALVIGAWSHHAASTLFRALNRQSHKEIREVVPPQNAKVRMAANCEQSLAIRMAFSPSCWPSHLLVDAPIVAALNDLFEFLLGVRRALGALADGWISGSRLRRIGSGERETQRAKRWKRGWWVMSELRHVLEVGLLEHLTNNLLETEWKDMESRLIKTHSVAEARKAVLKFVNTMVTKSFMRKDYLTVFTKMFAISHTLRDVICAAAEEVLEQDSRLAKDSGCEIGAKRKLFSKKNISYEWTQSDEDRWRIWETDLLVLEESYLSVRATLDKILENDAALENRSLLGSSVEAMLLKLNFNDKKKQMNSDDSDGKWSDFGQDQEDNNSEAGKSVDQ
eukprot:GDKJ01016438.1.p1 GENE.GDKJ01016438.1~~GDKJ01016438.1.p1  ORF type:complete len:1071 (-),score=198.30 GDKJ01016438.1:111-2933(-)